MPACHSPHKDGADVPMAKRADRPKRRAAAQPTRLHVMKTPSRGALSGEAR